jgi:hypothetical protein
VIPTANSKPPKQKNSNYKSFPFHTGFGIITQFNSRNQFCASKQSPKEELNMDFIDNFDKFDVVFEKVENLSWESHDISNRGWLRTGGP